MTLDEAIENNKHIEKSLRNRNSSVHADSVALGIEALEWVKRYRPRNKVDRWSLLPGETEN